MKVHAFIENVKDEMSELYLQGITQEEEQFAVWFLVNILQEDEWESMNRYYIGETGEFKIDIGILDRKHSSVIIAQCAYSPNPLEQTFGVDFLEELKKIQYRLKAMPDVGSKKRRIFASRYAFSNKPAKLLAVGLGTFSRDAFIYAKKNRIGIYDMAGMKKIYVHNNSFMEGI